MFNHWYYFFIAIHILWRMPLVSESFELVSSSLVSISMGQGSQTRKISQSVCLLILERHTASAPNFMLVFHTWITLDSVFKSPHLEPACLNYWHRDPDFFLIFQWIFEYFASFFLNNQLNLSLSLSLRRKGSGGGWTRERRYFGPSRNFVGRQPWLCPPHRTWRKILHGSKRSGVLSDQQSGLIDIQILWLPRAP